MAQAAQAAVVAYRPNDGKRFVHGTFKHFVNELRKEKHAKGALPTKSARMFKEFTVHKSIATAVNYRSRQGNSRSLRIYAGEIEHTKARFFFCMTESEYNEVFSKMLPSQQTFHEVLASVSGFNLFLDVDAVCDVGSSERQGFEDMLHEFVKWICGPSGLLPLRYNQRDIKYHVYDYDASSETYMSHHVIFCNMAFRSMEKMKQFVASIKRAWGMLDEVREYCNGKGYDLDAFLETIDEVPYRVDGQLRLPMNRDSNGERPLELSRLFHSTNNDNDEPEQQQELTDEVQQFAIAKSYIVLLPSGARDACLADASMKELLKDVGITDNVLDVVENGSEDKGENQQSVTTTADIVSSVIAAVVATSDAGASAIKEKIDHLPASQPSATLADSSSRKRSTSMSALFSSEGSQTSIVDLANSPPELKRHRSASASSIERLKAEVLERAQEKKKSDQKNKDKAKQKQKAARRKEERWRCKATQ